MKRPLGLILAGVALSLAALVCLLLTGSMVISAVMMHSHPNPALAAGPNPPSPGALGIALEAAALLFAGCAAWAISTVIGLLRLRPWARYSVLVIGGGLAFLGLASAASMALLSSVLPGAGATGQPGVSPGMMRAAYGSAVAVYLSLAIVGAWWLVYFNLRPVRAFFLPGYSPAYPQTYGAPPALSSGPYPDAGQVTQGASIAPPPPAPAPAGRFAHLPGPVAIVAVLFLISSVTCLAMAWLPLPAFAFGLILNCWPKHLLYLGLAADAGLTGLGLLKLDNRARLLGLGFVALGAANTVMGLLPWYQARMAVYQDQVYQRMHLVGPPPAAYTSHLLPLTLVWAIVLYGALAWVPVRFREVFRRGGAGA